MKLKNYVWFCIAAGISVLIGIILSIVAGCLHWGTAVLLINLYTWLVLAGLLLIGACVWDALEKTTGIYKTTDLGVADSLDTVAARVDVLKEILINKLNTITKSVSAEFSTNSQKTSDILARLELILEKVNSVTTTTGDIGTTDNSETLEYLKKVETYLEQLLEMSKKLMVGIFGSVDWEPGDDFTGVTMFSTPEFEPDTAEEKAAE